MSDQKLSELDVTTTPSSSDIAYVLDGGASRQTTLGNLAKGVTVTNLDTTGLTASQLLRVNSGGSAIESSGKTVPTGDIVGTTDTQTLSAKTLTAPTIGDFSNSAHDHSNAAGGGAVVSAGLTVAGVIEIATIAETDTGTDAGRAVSPDGLQGSIRNIRYIIYRVLDAATSADADTTVGGDFESPITGVMTDVGAYNDTAGVTGTATYDIHLNGTTIMDTTKISIETGEKSSRDALTQPVLSTTAISAGDLLTFDTDANQTTSAKGLTFRIEIRQT